MVDTGATHNFINPITGECLSLVIKEVSLFKVTIAGGEKFYANTYCFGIKIKLSGVKTIANW